MHSSQVDKLVYDPDGWGCPTWQHDDQRRWQALTTPEIAPS